MPGTTTGSREGQYCFASRLLGGRVFVDIGCSHGQFCNNTWVLEQAGWRGWLFDRDKAAISQCARTRKSAVCQCDARVFDFRAYFAQQRVPKIIDYISFDVDAATARAVKNFPFEEYSFLVMTIEHDLYRGPEAKQAIVERLAPFGEYRTIGDNMEAAPGKPFEDWIVNTRYFPPQVLAQAARSTVWWEFLDQFQF